MTAFATTVQIGSDYRVKVNRGTPRSGYCLKSTDRAKLRAEWLARPAAKAIPFIYGYRVDQTEADGRVIKANGWAQFGGKLFAVFYKVYWAKDGTEHTVQISTRRKVKDGLVWASARFVGTGDFSATSVGLLRAVAAAVEKNAVIQGANAPVIRTHRPAGSPNPERQPPTEDWSA